MDDPVGRSFAQSALQLHPPPPQQPGPARPPTTDGRPAALARGRRSSFFGVAVSTCIGFGAPENLQRILCLLGFVELEVRFGS